MTPLVLCTLIIIVTLAVSGVAKIKEPTSTVTAIVNLKLDQWLPVKPIAKILPWAELTLAAALLLLPGIWQVLAAIATVALFIGYWAAIARAVVQGNTATCNCFGSASTAPVSMFTLIRNTALLMASFGALIGAIVTRRSALTMLLATDVDGWLWLIGAGLAALVLWSIHRSEQTVRTVEQPVTDQPAESQPLPGNEAEDYLRSPIPFASLRYPAKKGEKSNEGAEVNLRYLSATQARLLIFVSPTCGSCQPVIEQLADWHQRLPMLGVHPVVSSESYLQQMDLPADMQPFVDPESKTGMLFGGATPSAVALGTDELLAGGPVYGSDDVTRFVEDIIGEMEHASAETAKATLVQEEAIKETDGEA